MKRIIIPVVLVIIIAVIVIFYIRNDRLSNTSSLTLSGTVEAVEIDLSFKASGHVTDVRFDESDDISEGDTVSELSHQESLARIRQVEDQIAAGRAQLRSLEIQKETLERNLEKISNLVSTGGATSGEQEDMQDKVREVSASITASKNTINSLISQKDYLQVVYEQEFLIAPSDGVVLVRTVEPGEVVTPGKIVLTMADLGNLKIRVYLPEYRLGQVKIGQDVSIEIDSYPGRRFEGTISRIADKAEFTPKNVQTRDERVKTVFAVTVRTGDQGGILKPGMPCDVIIDLNR